MRTALDEACDVGDVEVRRVLRRRLPEVAEPVVALIGDRAARLIRIDGTERVVLCCGGLQVDWINGSGRSVPIRHSRHHRNFIFI